MSYSVQFGDKVTSKIVAWALPKEGMTAILRRMDELREMPSRNLLRVDSASHILQSDVLYRDPGPPSRDCLIVLSVRYGADEESLYIVDCARLLDDKPD
jgi:hypothetical protein